MKLFITGTFRSGMTLILQILNVSNEVAITYDTVNFMRFCYKGYGKVKVTIGDALKMAEDVGRRLKQRNQPEFEVNSFKEFLNKSKNSSFSYAFLYDEMMKKYMNTENWGDRTDLEWRESIDLLNMFDDIYIIHVIRDPRDVLASWQKMTYAPGNDYLDAIANCYDSMKLALKHKKDFSKRYYVLQFEELLKNPEEKVREVCNFVGLKFNKQMLDISNFKSKIGGRWDPSKHTSFKDKINKISTKPAGRWKEHLISEDVLLTELATKDLMEVFGYELAKKSWGIEEIISALKRLFASSLATESFVNIFKNNQGVERFPQDPLDSSSWSKIEQ